MAAHHQWTEWHLTPCGWVRGSEKSEIGSVFEVEPAEGRVLTCRYEAEYDGNAEEPVKSCANETWRSADVEEAAKLVRIFGECPRTL